jgi:hypothetical protein
MAIKSWIDKDGVRQYADEHSKAYLKRTEREPETPDHSPDSDGAHSQALGDVPDFVPPVDTAPADKKAPRPRATGRSAEESPS